MLYLDNRSSRQKFWKGLCFGKNKSRLHLGIPNCFHIHILINITCRCVDFWATVCKTVRPMLWDRCLSACNVLPVCLYRWTCIVAKRLDASRYAWHGGRPRPRPHCVRWGPSSPHQNGHSPQFFAHVRCGHTAGWIKMSVGTQIGLDPGNIVLDGDLAPSKRGQHPSLFGHVDCGHAAGLIKMPLGTEVDLGPGLNVLDDPGPPPPTEHSPRNFSPISVVAKWLDGSRCHLVGR